MQIDPIIIPDAAVERLARLMLSDSIATWGLLSDAVKHKCKRAAADMLREIIPLLAVPRQPAIVRLDETGDLDEVILEGVGVHIERMRDNSFWIGFDHPDGTVDHVTIRAKRAMVTMTFQEDC